MIDDIKGSDLTPHIWTRAPHIWTRAPHIWPRAPHIWNLLLLIRSGTRSKAGFMSTASNFPL